MACIDEKMSLFDFIIFPVIIKTFTTRFAGDTETQRPLRQGWEKRRIQMWR
jgi:hypothetical protein